MVIRVKKMLVTSYFTFSPFFLFPSAPLKKTGAKVTRCFFSSPPRRSLR
jgi:hypothetical protein